MASIAKRDNAYSVLKRIGAKDITFHGLRHTRLIFDLQGHLNLLY